MTPILKELQNQAEEKEGTLLRNVYDSVDQKYTF